MINKPPPPPPQILNVNLWCIRYPVSVVCLLGDRVKMFCRFPPKLISHCVALFSCWSRWCWGGWKRTWRKTLHPKRRPSSKWSWPRSRKSSTGRSWSATLLSCPRERRRLQTCRTWWTPWWSCASAATTPSWSTAPRRKSWASTTSRWPRSPTGTRTSWSKLRASSCSSTNCCRSWSPAATRCWSSRRWCAVWTSWRITWCTWNSPMSGSTDASGATSDRRRSIASASLTRTASCSCCARGPAAWASIWQPLTRLSSSTPTGTRRTTSRRKRVATGSGRAGRSRSIDSSPGTRTSARCSTAPASSSASTRPCCSPWTPRRTPATRWVLSPARLSPKQACPLGTRTGARRKLPKGRGLDENQTPSLSVAFEANQYYSWMAFVGGRAVVLLAFSTRWPRLLCALSHAMQATFPLNYFFICL